MVFRSYLDEVTAVMTRGVRVNVDGVPTRVGGDLPPWDRENLVQDTFLRAFKEEARASYDGLRPFGAWLCTIARNLLVDRARQRAREGARVVAVEEIDAAAGPELDPTSALHAKRLSETMSGFVGTLDEGDRRLFHTRYEEELSLRQAARELGVGLYELRRRDARLRLRLLDALRTAGFFQDRNISVGTSVLQRFKGKSGTGGENGA